jgi:tetratricopeptide (TPR) repeat protein
MLTKENGFELPLKWTFPDANKYAFAFISLFVILIIIYSNSFQGDWHFDDFANIIENQHIQIKSLSLPEIKQSFTGIYQDRILRPFSYLSFALNYYVGGLNVFGFHLVNFFIHYLSSVFLFLFIFNTLKLPLCKDQYTNIAYPVALLATILWSIHPVFVTSVSYIVQRMTSMAGLFYIMSMYFYLKGRTSEKTGKAIVFYLFCVLSGLSSLLTKENAVMLPFSILLFDLLLIQGATKENIKKFFKFLILPLILFILVGFLYTGGFSNNVFGGYAGRDFTMFERLLTEPRIIIFYLSLLFYPIHSRLTLLYDIDISHSLWQTWTTMPSIFLILLFIAAAIYLCRKRPLLSFCILFFFLNHAIEGTVLPLELIFEHRNYLPAMLLFIPMAQFFVYVIDYFSYKRILQFAVTIGVIIIIVGLGDVTFRRNAIFSDEFLLWSDNIEKYPNLSRPYTNLGLYYLKREQKDIGGYYLIKGIQLDKFSNSNVRNLQVQNLGIYYFKEGHYDIALKYFQITASNMPSNLFNKNYMAYIYLSKGEYASAHQLIEPLLKKAPENIKLIETFCLILLKENKLEEAELFAKKILKKEPNSTFPLVILAEVARKKEKFRSAVLYWQQYQLSYPLDPYCNLALIELYEKTNEKEKLKVELAKLFCLKEDLSLKDYIKKLYKKEKFLAYVPDTNLILTITHKNIQDIFMAD